MSVRGLTMLTAVALSPLLTTGMRFPVAHQLGTTERAPQVLNVLDITPGTGPDQGQCVLHTVYVSRFNSMARACDPVNSPEGQADIASDKKAGIAPTIVINDGCLKFGYTFYDNWMEGSKPVKNYVPVTVCQVGSDGILRRSPGRTYPLGAVAERK